MQKCSVEGNKPLIETMIMNYDVINELSSMNIYHSKCKINMRRFPFDVQNCTLQFGSWAYADNMITPEIKDMNANMSLDWYSENPEWELITNGASRNCKRNLSALSDWCDLTI